MCSTSKDFTVSLDHVSHFLSIHKAELHPLAVLGECGILFSEKLG